MSRKELYTAISDGDADAVSTIVTQMPDLITQVAVRESWLNLAAEKNAIDCMAVLLDKGIPVDVGWENSQAPICSAANFGRFEAVEWLLNHGAKVEGNGNQTPPLVGAISSNSIGIVKLLLEHGAKTDYTWGHFNYSPKTFAESFGPSHAEIAKLLGGEKEAESAPASSGDVDPIVQHLEKYYGKLEPLSLHEIVSDLPVTIHVIKLKQPQPCTLLVTSGMSEYKMSVPQGAEQYQYAELIMYLPPDWPTNDEAIQKPEFSWPFEWMRRIAHYPMQYDTWIGETGSFSNEEPPQPFASNTELSGILALAEVNEGGQLNTPDKLIQFYSLYPVYKEEMNLANTKGTTKLIEKFHRNNIPTVLDLKRKNVGKSWFSWGS